MELKVEKVEELYELKLKKTENPFNGIESSSVNSLLPL